MIKICDSEAGSRLALVALDAIFRTPSTVYTLSCDDPMIGSRSSFADARFGAISWPVSPFRLAEGALLEQQMFLPHDRSAVAVSWALTGDTIIAAQLIVRPFFAGCGPRSYRDVGFHSDSEHSGGRLTWLPNVRGPRVFADTNGRYHDEPVRFLDCFCDQAAASESAGDLITPGRFEFQLSRRPAVLILSMGDPATTRQNQHIGVFLAGLMQENSPGRPESATGDSIAVPKSTISES